jgi:hypothetical protein
MPEDGAREELLKLIDRKAFEPVLKASPDKYRSDNDRRKLEDVQKTTRSTQERYHEAKTAKEVRERFRGDLSSSAAKKVHGELRSLGLPTLPETKEEFEALADKHGVGR